MNVAYTSIRFLMKPWKPRKELFHFKFSRAITYGSTNQMIYELRKYIAHKPRILMLSINTAIGSVTQCEILVDAFRQATKNLDIPFYTFIDDYALGTGYQLACASDKIYANPFSIIGDASVSEKQFGFQNLMKKYNVNYQLNGCQSLLLDSFREISQEQHNFMEEDIQIQLDTMIKCIRHTRKELDVNSLNKVYSAQQAKQQKLVDEILCFDEYQQQMYPNYKVRELTLFKDAQAMIIVKAQSAIWKSVWNILDKVTLENISLARVELMELLEECFNDQIHKQALNDLILEFINSIELVDYQKQVEKYISEHKMTDVFENLTRMLVLSRPADPISFLVDALEHRRMQRLILISGVVVPVRQDIVTQVANQLNYKVIATEDLFKGDIGWVSNDQINESVQNALKNIERHFRGVIISGYPNNIQQAYYLQQKDKVPERFFYLESDLDFQRSYYDTFCNSEVSSKALTRDRLNRKDLESVYGKYMDVFNTSKRTKDDIVDNIIQILRLRDRKHPPLRFPRVCLIRPPHLRERSQQLCQIFSKRYGLKSIITFELIEQQIKNNGTLGVLIQNSLQQQATIPNDIINSLVYTEFLGTEARSKGYVLEGYPKNEAQLKFLEKQQINLIIILTEDEDVLFNKCKSLKLDPLTKIKYEKVPLNNKPLLDRLINYQIQDEIALKNKINQYTEFTKKIENIYGEQVQIFKLEKDTTENIIKIADVFLNNSKIYN